MTKKKQSKDNIVIVHDEYYDPGYDEDNEFLTIGDGEYPTDDIDKSKISDKEWKEYQENMQNGNFLRNILIFYRPPTKKLSYPTKVVQVGIDFCELYDIPLNEIINIIDSIKPDGYGSVYKKMYCLREKKSFNGNEFKIIFFNGANYIVSPYFFHSGGTFIECIKQNDDE